MIDQCQGNTVEKLHVKQLLDFSEQLTRSTAYTVVINNDNLYS